MWPRLMFVVASECRYYGQVTFTRHLVFDFRVKEGNIPLLKHIFWISSNLLGMHSLY